MNKSMNPARQVLGGGLQEETGVRVDRIYITADNPFFYHFFYTKMGVYLRFKRPMYLVSSKALEILMHARCPPLSPNGTFC